MGTTARVRLAVTAVLSLIFFAVVPPQPSAADLPVVRATLAITDTSTNVTISPLTGQSSCTTEIVGTASGTTQGLEQGTWVNLNSVQLPDGGTPSPTITGSGTYTANCAGMQAFRFVPTAVTGTATITVLASEAIGRIIGAGVNGGKTTVVGSSPITVTNSGSTATIGLTTPITIPEGGTNATALPSGCLQSNGTAVSSTGAACAGAATPVSVVAGSGNVTIATPSPGVFSISVATQSPSPVSTPVSVQAGTGIAVATPSPGVFVVSAGVNPISYFTTLTQTVTSNIYGCQGENLNLYIQPGISEPVGSILQIMDNTNVTNNYSFTFAVTSQTGNELSGECVNWNGLNYTATTHTFPVGSFVSVGGVGVWAGTNLITGDGNGPGNNQFLPEISVTAAPGFTNVSVSSLTAGDCVQATTGGKLVSAAAACGAGSGGVTAVTGTAPIVSSGGTTPAISCATCVTSVTAGSNIVTGGTSTAPTIAVTAAPAFGNTTVANLTDSALSANRCAEPNASKVFTSSSYACGSGQDMWLTTYPTGGFIYRIDGQGNVATYTVSGIPYRGITAADGYFYYSDNAANNTYHSISPAGVVSTFSGSASSAILSFSMDSTQRVWFTQDGTPGGFNLINQNGTLSFYPVSSGDIPLGLTLGPDGNMWATLYGAAGVAKVTPTGTVTRYPNIFASGSNPIGITTGVDGYLYVTGNGSNSVYKVSTTGALIATTTLPTSNSQPTGIITGPDGNIWFGEANHSVIGKLTPTGLLEYTTNAPTIFPAVGPDGNIWFTESGNSKVGNIALNGAYYTESPAGGAVYGIYPGFGSPIFSNLYNSDGNIVLTSGGSKDIVLSQNVVIGNSLAVSTLTSGDCVQATTGGKLVSAASACGSGGGSVGAQYPLPVYTFTVGQEWDFSTARNISGNVSNATGFDDYFLLGGKTIKTVSITCLPFQSTDANTPYSTDVQGYDPSSTGITGGTLTLNDYGTTGTTVIGTITLPDSPAGGPYVNHATVTLGTPYTLPLGDLVLTDVAVTSTGSADYYQSCTASIGT